MIFFDLYYENYNNVQQNLERIFKEEKKSWKKLEKRISPSYLLCGLLLVASDIQFFIV